MSELTQLIANFAASTDPVPRALAPIRLWYNQGVVARLPELASHLSAAQPRVAHGILSALVDANNFHELSHENAADVMAHIVGCLAIDDKLIRRLAIRAIRALAGSGTPLPTGAADTLSALLEADPKDVQVREILLQDTALHRTWDAWRRLAEPSNGADQIAGAAAASVTSAHQRGEDVSPVLDVIRRFRPGLCTTILVEDSLHRQRFDEVLVPLLASEGRADWIRDEAAGVLVKSGQAQAFAPTLAAALDAHDEHALSAVQAIARAGAVLKALEPNVRGFLMLSNQALRSKAALVLLGLSTPVDQEMASVIEAQVMDDTLPYHQRQTPLITARIAVEHGADAQGLLPLVLRCLAPNGGSEKRPPNERDALAAIQSAAAALVAAMANAGGDVSQAVRPLATLFSDLQRDEGLRVAAGLALHCAGRRHSLASVEAELTSKLQPTPPTDARLQQAFLDWNALRVILQARVFPTPSLFADAQNIASFVHGLVSLQAVGDDAAEALCEAARVSKQAAADVHAAIVKRFTSGAPTHPAYKAIACCEAHAHSK